MDFDTTKYISLCLCALVAKNFMKHIFKKGDIKEYRSVVKPEDVASFNGVVVHPVCSTFALAREIEWTTRLFTLEVKEADEEGIGTYLQIEHQAPAFVGEEIVFRATFNHLSGNELICTVDAYVGDRLVARAKTGQRILKLDKIKSIFDHG
jgi:fluoroacetyl-CoA thioesterase